MGDGMPPVESAKIVKRASGSFATVLGSCLGVLGEVLVVSDPEMGTDAGEPIGEGIGGVVGGEVTGLFFPPRFALAGGGVSGGGACGMRCYNQRVKRREGEILYIWIIIIIKGSNIKDIFCYTPCRCKNFFDLEDRNSSASSKWYYDIINIKIARFEGSA